MWWLLINWLEYSSIEPDSLLKENILNKKVSFIAEITNYFYSAMKKVLG